MQKNKSAVHLGRVSAEKKKKKMGEKYRIYMRELALSRWKKQKTRIKPTQNEG